MAVGIRVPTEPPVVANIRVLAGPLSLKRRFSHLWVVEFEELELKQPELGLLGDVGLDGFLSWPPSRVIL